MESHRHISNFSKFDYKYHDICNQILNLNQKDDINRSIIFENNIMTFDRYNIFNGRALFTEGEFIIYDDLIIYE